MFYLVLAFINKRYEKTEGAIKNGQSCDTGNIGSTQATGRRQARPSKKSKHNTTKKPRKMSNTNPIKNPGVNQFKLIVGQFLLTENIKTSNSEKSYYLLI